MGEDDAVEIKFEQIVHLIQQFCLENGLFRSFQQLQDESRVKYSTISNTEEFMSNFINGKWDLVLETVESLDLPLEILIELYEHMVLEMIECKEIGVAKTIMLNSLPIQLMKETDPKRYLRLEHLPSKTTLTLHDIYGTTKKELKRIELGNEILKQVSIASPHRLLDLLKDSITLQKHYGNIPGKQYNIFNGCF